MNPNKWDYRVIGIYLDISIQVQVADRYSFIALLKAISED